jgi:hypothetical protein
MKSSMRTAEPRDEELLRALLDGDEQAFTALYRRRQAGLFRFALQMGGSAAVVEDVTQEVFLTLIRDGIHSHGRPRRATISDAPGSTGMAPPAGIRMLIQHNETGDANKETRGKQTVELGEPAPTLFEALRTTRMSSTLSRSLPEIDSTGPMEFKQFRQKMF